MEKAGLKTYNMALISVDSVASYHPASVFVCVGVTTLSASTVANRGTKKSCVSNSQLQHSSAGNVHVITTACQQLRKHTLTGTEMHIM